MRQWRRLAVCILASGLTVGGCGDDGDDDDTSGQTGDGDSAGGGGGTSCGPQNCEAGQHCNNLVCVDGCLSDTNCASNQTCEDIDTDSHIGTCRAKPMQQSKDCDAFCDKAEVCSLEGSGIGPSNCMQACLGLSAACVSCVNDSNCGDGCDGVCDTGG